MFDRARQVNLSCVTEVKFLGHIFNGMGVKPDPDKIKAIFNMSSFKQIKNLQRFLGMIDYLSSSIPKLANETIFLCSLLKKGSAWFWNEKCEPVFNIVKNCITTAPVLSYYNSSLPITFSSDASQFAVERVILENNKSCDFAS